MFDAGVERNLADCRYVHGVRLCSNKHWHGRFG